MKHFIPSFVISHNNNETFNPSFSEGWYVRPMKWTFSQNQTKWTMRLLTAPIDRKANNPSGLKTIFKKLQDEGM